MDGHDRAVCAACGWVHYDNPAPCVGAVLVRDGMVLLSKRAREPYAGQWDLPGGFLEPGESPVDGLAREVLEETGLAVTGLRLQGAWTGDYGGRATVNLVYTGRPEGEPAAADDSLELRWFPLDALPAMAFPHEAEALAAIGP